MESFEEADAQEDTADDLATTTVNGSGVDRSKTDTTLVDDTLKGSYRD